MRCICRVTLFPLKLFRRFCSHENWPDCVIENLYESDVYPLNINVNKEKLFNYHYNFVHNLSLEDMDVEVGASTHGTENETTILYEAQKAHDLSSFDSSTSKMYESVSEKLYFLRTNWRKATGEEKKVLRQLRFPNIDLPVKISPFENAQPKANPFPLSLVPRMIEYVAEPIELMDMNGPLKRIIREELAKHGLEAFKNLVAKGWLNDQSQRRVNLNYIHYHYLRKQFEDTTKSVEKKDPDLLRDMFVDFYREYSKNSCYHNVENYISECILKDPLKSKHYYEARSTIMKQIPHWTKWTKVNWEELQCSNVDKSQLKASRRLYRSLMIGDLVLFDLKLFVNKYIKSIKDIMITQNDTFSQVPPPIFVDSIDPIKFSIDQSRCKFWIEDSCYIDFKLEKDSIVKNNVFHPIEPFNFDLNKILQLIFTRFCTTLYQRFYLNPNKNNHIKIYSISDMIEWTIGEFALSKQTMENIFEADDCSYRNLFYNHKDELLRNCCYIGKNDLFKYLENLNDFEELLKKLNKDPVTSDDVLIDIGLLSEEDNEITKLTLINSYIEQQLINYICRKAKIYNEKFNESKNYNRKIKLQIMRNLSRRNKNLNHWLSTL